MYIIQIELLYGGSFGEGWEASEVLLWAEECLQEHLLLLP